MLHQSAKDGPRVFAVAESLRCSFQGRYVCISGADEIDIANLNQHVGDFIDNRIDWAVLLSCALVFDVTRDRVFDKQRLENVRNLVGEPSAKRQFAIEERSTFLNAFEQVLVREPDKVFKAGRDEFGSLSDLQLEFGANGGKRVGVADIGKDSVGAQAGGRLLEIVFGYDRADLQTTGSNDGGLGESFVSGDLYRNQLTLRGWGLREGLLRVGWMRVCDRDQNNE